MVLKFLEVLPSWHSWGGNWVIKKHNVVLELTKLEYHVTFFFLFLDYRQINIEINVVYFISKVLKLGELEYRRNKINSILFIKCTRARYTRVLCCMVLEYTKLEYHIIFFNRPISTSAMPQWQNFKEVKFLKLEYHKSGISLISSETILFGYKFLKMVVFGHFHLKLCIKS